ncbi:MAG: hypothetical protein H7Y12_10860 [Sphingobacteriaceae bacterium]|nr:hypothetical protein [Cytophagaceae bacterium]
MNASLRRVGLALWCLMPTCLVAQTAYYEKPIVVLNPDHADIAPSNVVRTRTFNAAIYPVINSVKVKLALENPLRTSLRIRLLNERGMVLFTDQLSRNWKSSLRNFDMSGMKDGTYTLEISDGVNTQPLEFRVESREPVPVVVSERVIAVR